MAISMIGRFLFVQAKKPYSQFTSDEQKNSLQSSSKRSLSLSLRTL